MVGIKRKQSASSGTKSSRIKKRKHTSPPAVESSTSSNLEAETDSDPIIESDTTDHSGDGDGVSWPSDQDEDTQDEKEAAAGVQHKSPRQTGPTAAPETANGTSSLSKESHTKQKALAHERKAAKPNADSIARSKKLWERLRRKSHVPLDERKKLVAELFDIITGHVKDFVLKHDSVRVVQTAIKYANRDQRKMIAKELKGEFRNLAESRYAKFLLGKLLVHGDKEIRDLIVPEFYGHVRRLIKHPEASWILDDVYRGAATSQQKDYLLREWFGAEFAIFKSEGKENATSVLESILAQNPEKRKPVMHALHDLINQLIQKKTTGFTMLHDAMRQYMLNINPGSEEMTEFIELLKGDEEGDLLKNLAFTSSGAGVVSMALAHGNAKDRKLIVRAYKNLFSQLAHDEHGHQIILAAYDVIDDTVLTSKSILPELVGKSADPDETQTEALTTAINHKFARIPFLYLFANRRDSFMDVTERRLLDTVHRTRTETSKKDPATRRKELIAHMSPPLLSLIANNAATLVQSSFGCQFMMEVLPGAGSNRAPALKAVVALVHSESSEVQEALKTPAAGRLFKTLVQGGPYDTQHQRIKIAEPALGFHNLFFEALQGNDQVLDWATSDNSFVIVGLLEAEGFENKEKLRKILKKSKQRLEEAADQRPKVSTAETGRKKVKGKGENKGVRLLLQNIV
ncbi:Pumilio y domain member 6 [Xanthoria calcicola]